MGRLDLVLWINGFGLVKWMDEFSLFLGNILIWIGVDRIDLVWVFGA